MLRKKGLIAIRSDNFYGRGTCTLHYNLDPYLAALALLESQDDAHRGNALHVEGTERLAVFAKETAERRWQWQVGATSSEVAGWRVVAEAFVALHELPVWIPDQYRAVDDPRWPL